MIITSKFGAGIRLSLKQIMNDAYFNVTKRKAYRGQKLRGKLVRRLKNGNVALARHGDVVYGACIKDGVRSVKVYTWGPTALYEKLLGPGFRKAFQDTYNIKLDDLSITPRLEATIKKNIKAWL